MDLTWIVVALPLRGCRSVSKLLSRTATIECTLHPRRLLSFDTDMPCEVALEFGIRGVFFVLSGLPAEILNNIYTFMGHTRRFTAGYAPPSVWVYGLGSVFRIWLLADV